MSEPVRWGFLGAGNIARTALGPAVRAADGAVLQSAAARDRTRAAALGPVRAYDDYRAVLDDDEVDAVYVALTNDQHLPWTLAALAAGKHVLCEKPLGLSAGEVDAVVQAAEAADREVVEASWYRWHPRVRLAQARLAELGTVQHVAAGFLFDSELEGDYRLEPGRGGGALYDVGCYAVSACLWAVGRGVPADVVAQSRRGPTGVDLESRAVLRWPAGSSAGIGGIGGGSEIGAGAEVEAEVHVGISGGGSGQWLVITGDRGELELREHSFTAWKDDPTELWLSDGTGTERVAVPATDAYRLMVEEVSSALRGGPGWLLPLSESRQTAAVLDAAFGSAAGDGAPSAVRP